MRTTDPEIPELIRKLSESFGPNLRPPGEQEPDMKAERLRALLTELASRRKDGLLLYQPLPIPQKFHECCTKWKALIGSNRSSKTLSGAAECSRAWRGMDPFDKYRQKNGNSLVVGRDQDHLALMWAKCSQPGAFKIIRDEHTKQWRAVRPDPNNPHELDPYDVAYNEKWEDAPPMIPPRAIKRIAYDDFGKGVPRVIVFNTGWMSLWRSSEGKPAQGDAYQLVWFDEELVNRDFLNEAIRGLVTLGIPNRYRPKGIWTASAQEGNPELERLIELSQQGVESIDLFNLLIADNPYVSASEVKTFGDMLTDEEREVRVDGVSGLTGRRVYPMFNADVHTCEPFDIPDSWARYVFVDPGRQHCGTLFCAVDPDEQHDWIYDGFDLRKGDAPTWAKWVKDREQGRRFHAIVIDARMGVETHVGANDSVAEVYWRALEEAGVRPKLAGSQRKLAGFFAGCNVIRTREEALIGKLRVREEGPFAGTPRLMIFRGRVPLLERQMRSAAYERIKVGRQQRDDKRLKLQEDCLVCAEYYAAFNPYYTPSEPIVAPESVRTAFDAFQEKLDKQMRQSPFSSVAIH